MRRIHIFVAAICCILIGSVVLATILYNVKTIRVNNELVEVHHRPDGRYVACGITFTAATESGNTRIQSAVRARLADLCGPRDDVVSTSSD
jgi:hypothetical protein